MTENLKSIHNYLERRQARRDAMRAASQKWAALIMTSNAAGAITIASQLTDSSKMTEFEPFQRIGLAFALLMFALALLPSIMGAVALSMAPRHKALMDQPLSEAKKLKRNLALGGVGFILGLAFVIGAMGGMALQVIIDNL